MPSDVPPGVLEYAGFSRCAVAGKPQWLNSLLKNLALDLALKGRGFKPRHKCHEINFGFSC